MGIPLQLLQSPLPGLGIEPEDVVIGDDHIVGAAEMLNEHIQFLAVVIVEQGQNADCIVIRKVTAQRAGAIAYVDAQGARRNGRDDPFCPETGHFGDDGEGDAIHPGQGFLTGGEIAAR